MINRHVIILNNLNIYNKTNQVKNLDKQYENRRQI